MSITAASVVRELDQDKSANRRVKVVHVITGDLFAGAERVQDLLAAQLPAFGYDVSFICLKEGEYQQRLLAENRDVSTLAMRSRFDLARTALQIANRVRAVEGQLIHTHTVRGSLIGSIAAALTGLPMVHHIHSPTSRNTANGWTNRFNTLVERVSLMRGVLIPVSDSLAQYLVLQGYAASRISTVHNGVPVGELRSPSPECGRPLTLGMVALFRPRKGIEVLLHAMARLVEQGQQVRLRAVGTFECREYEEHVLALAAKLGVSGCVEWRGFQRNVLDELAQVHVLVVPSLFGEGLPMVILEAMAVGLPVVAAEVEGIPEAIRDGQEGSLVPPGDPQALATALLRLASDPDGARGMGIAGQRRQRKQFSDVAMAGHVSQIYDRLLARGAWRTG
jgi:glycosyltransferase involved in cell wall biosynthesis